MVAHNDGITPDRFELWLRFGFGALFGALLAGAMLLAGMPRSPGRVFATASAALVGGLLARHFGDRFWYSVRRWLFLFWP